MTHATHATQNKITRLTQKSMPNTISLSYSTTGLFHHTNLCAKNYLRNSTSNFCILFSIFCGPPRVSIFCLPADEPIAVKT